MSKQLPALFFALIATLVCGPAIGNAEWVTHASRAGPDRAPVGQSRFDDLFRSTDGSYRIPYPFEALLARLESVIDNGQHSGVRRVLIPLGRSLQRDAAAPDFFGFPRIVAALQGEPNGSAEAPQRVLEYRLFIAHQPKSQGLEVISYNDAAGRFEFQVVDDYRAGGEMRVRQANRRMCLGCHQNAGPIFATRPWNETNFNFRIARRLAERNPERYDSFVTALGGDADAIDLLSDRANYLSAAQLIWQRGCGRIECRAAVLRALLQYRLSGKSGFEREHATYRQDYLDDLQRNWAVNWPRGLALASSRIADRDPLEDAAPTRAEDPLTPRPPHARWQRFDAVLADGIVFRLAGFLTRSDIRRIDRYLVQSAQRRAQPLRELTSRCRLANVGVETRLLECSNDADAAAPRATLELDYRDGALQTVSLLSLRLPGDPGILQPAVSALTRLADGVALELQHDTGISMRLANGERLAALELRWKNPDLRDETWIRLSLSREFELIDAALQALLQHHRDGNASSLDDGPFQRRAILAEFGQALGADRLARGAVTDRPPPGVNRTRGADSPDFADPDLFLLQAHCGQCHGADTRQPPGFLAGADAERRVAQCAPRILARLLAWRREANDQVVPMPPPASVSAGWHEGDHYHRLVAALERLLERDGTARPVDTGIDAYRTLDRCVAPG